MSQTTLSRTVNAVEDIRVGLNNSSITRLLSIGTNWNYLRVGIRASIDPAIYNTNNLGKNIFVGVCSGTSNGWNNGSATTTHAVGLLAPAIGNASNAPASVSSGGITGFAFYNGSGAKRIGTTITESAVALINTVYLEANSDYRAGMWLVDIEKKTSPTAWNIKSFQMTSLSATPHLTKESFLGYMGTPFASLSLGNYQTSATSTLAVDEATNGYLDSVNIFSDMNGAVEISDVAVARFS